MIVYALVGESGTGKSFQASKLCKQKGIEAIIDDGLFIYQGEVKAGKSAKKEETKVGAIKTALFTKDEHRRTVVRKIEQQNLSKILLIGTSIGMVEKIAMRLELPKISNFVFIEEITSLNERDIAKNQRLVHGKHVVPVPEVEIKRQFSGYFLNPLRRFRGFSGGGDSSYGDRTEVRPTFSYLGDVKIAEKVLKDIVMCSTTETDGILTVIKVVGEETRKGIIVTILLSMNNTENLIENTEKFQSKTYKMIEHMTSYNVASLNIEIRDVK